MASFLRPTSLLANFSRLTIGSSSASSPSTMLSSRSTLLSSSSLPLASCSSPAHPLPLFQPRMQARHKALQPRRTKYRKAHKGRYPIALGGSTKGTTLEWGDFGLRVNEPCRLSANHLETAEAALKRGLKTVRGCKVYMRVFPDIPVCIKGNETRMGKGKGTFEFWACRAGVGRVIFEIGGPNLKVETAHTVMKLAAAKLPVTTEIIDKTSAPRVGFTTITEVPKLPKIITKGQLDALAAIGVAPEPVLEKAVV